jgi:hypothetical protein
VEQDSPPHIRKSDATHDDQGTDHEALGPCFEGQFCQVGRLLLRSDFCVGHLDGVGDACVPWMWKENATQQASCRRAVEETVKAGVLCVGRPLHAAARKDTDESQSGEY